MSTSKPKPSSLFGFPNADRTILITHRGKPAVGHVYSGAMINASPVWKKLINPLSGRLVSGSNGISMLTVPGADMNTAEGESIQEAELPPLEFQEDDSEALYLLLRIAHDQFANIPTKLPFAKLLAVAVLVDQYDCVELIIPWVQSWIATEAVDSMIGGQESWLSIAWVLGREDTFNNLAGALSRDLDAEKMEKFLPGPIPTLDIEVLRKTRLEQIQQILDVPYQIADDLESQRSNASFPNSICNYGDRRCDAHIYNALTLGLGALNLWPKKKAVEIPVSVWTLASQLENMHMSVQRGGYRQHSSCGLVALDIKSNIDRILDTKPIIASDEQLHHIRTQHKRLNPPPKSQ